MMENLNKGGPQRPQGENAEMPIGSGASNALYPFGSFQASSKHTIMSRPS